MVVPFDLLNEDLYKSLRVRTLVLYLSHIEAVSDYDLKSLAYNSQEHKEIGETCSTFET